VKSFRTSYATWRGSPNFTPDRDGHDMAVPPAWVVLHTMVGTEAAADARFQQPSEQASAHYGVKLDGSIVQWVDERDSAWTNGNSGVEGAIGRNEDSVTIEHEDDGDYNGPRTPELYAASARLVRDICLRYQIPIDREHVIGHRECTGNAPTACPDALDMDRIVAAAAAGEDMTPDEHNWLQGLFNGWFLDDSKLGNVGTKLDTILQAIQAIQPPPPLDVEALAQALVAHLPAGADAQAVAQAVVAELGAKLTV
jgi:N-acetyl-anhydromuramyl-L-alanine amidase AmpD